MPKLEITGLDKLQKRLKENATMNNVKKVVKVNGDELNNRMKVETKSAFKKGYSHGDTASTINTNIVDGGLTAEVGPTTNYSPYVEHGTRFMEPEPFAAPAFNVQKKQFKSDLQKLVR